MEILTETLGNYFWGIVLVAYVAVAAIGVYYRMKDVNSNLHHGVRH